MDRQTANGQRVVQGSRESLQRVHQSSVEIENQTVFHAVKLAGFRAAGKRLERLPFGGDRLEI